MFDRIGSFSLSHFIEIFFFELEIIPTKRIVLSHLRKINKMLHYK